MLNRTASGFALAGILCLSLILRVWGIGFGLPHANARPDETAVAGPAVSFLSGNLEPPHFIYPTGFMYALSGAYVAYYEATRPWASYKTLAEFAESRRQNIAPFLLISRSISVAFGVLTVAWLYLLGRGAAGTAAGLAAAALLAVAFLHVRDSHFGVTDATMTGLVVLAVHLIVKWHEKGGVMLAASAGLVGGMAMATKYNGLGVALPFAVAAADRFVTAAKARRRVSEIAVPAAAFLAVFAAVFLAGSFYIFIQPDRFLHDVTLQSRTLEAGHGLWLPRGWLYHAVVTLPAALGWPLFVTGVAGIVWHFVRDARKAMVVFAFPIAYYIVAGTGRTVFARYMMPELPFLCLGAGYACVRVAEIAAGVSRRRVAASIALVVALAMPTAIKAVQVDRLLSRTDNRVLVARAIEAILPREATIHHTGSIFAHVQFPAALRLREVPFNEEAGRFDGALPDWIIVQRSPLTLLSSVPPQLTALLMSEYRLTKAFPVGDDRPRTYDPQDAFFLPLNGLGGLDRPGPGFELYQRR